MTTSSSISVDGAVPFVPRLSANGLNRPKSSRGGSMSSRMNTEQGLKQTKRQNDNTSDLSSLYLVNDTSGADTGRDILEILNDRITGGYNHFQVWRSLGLNSKSSIDDFIRALIHNFNLFDSDFVPPAGHSHVSQKYSNSTQHSNKAHSRRDSRTQHSIIPQRSKSLPPAVEKYQLSQIEKLADCVEQFMKFPLRFNDFVAFCDHLNRNSNSLSTEYTRNVSRYSSTMNWGQSKRQDRFRNLFGLEKPYDETLIKRTQDSMPPPVQIAPFENDPIDEGDYAKTHLKQSPEERYRAYEEPYEFMHPEELRKLRLEYYRQKSLSNKRNFKRQETRTSILRSRSVAEDITSRDKSHLSKIYGPRTTRAILHNQKEIEQEQASRFLQSRRTQRTQRPQTATKAAPRYMRHLNREQRPVSASASSFSRRSGLSVPTHLLTSQTSGVRLI